MKKINNKGFTLVEILAVVIILGILIAIMIPNVNSLLKKNEEENYKKLIESIENATSIYISNYRYEIILTNNSCSENEYIDIDKVSTNDLDPNSHIKILTLVDEGVITTKKDGNIYNPKNKKSKLDLNESYISVQYNCQTKEYIYSEPTLVWE